MTDPKRKIAVDAQQLGKCVDLSMTPEVCAIHNNFAYDVLPITYSAVRALLCR
jgi:hypothetical protein